MKINTIELLFLGTQSCHLCEQAEMLLTSLDLPEHIHITKIDIAEKTEWQADYATRIPVLYDCNSQKSLHWKFEENMILDFFKFIKNNMISIQKSLDLANANLNQISDSARLDAEVLLAFVLKKNRSYLRAWREKLLTQEEITQFRHLIEQRKKGIPIAYLTGVREFWSREFAVNSDVLIPRPETELLIELCLNLMPDDSNYRILDLGTGSGVIAITLAKEKTNIDVIAVDASFAALNVAQKNAQNLNCQNVDFILSDWFEHLELQHFDFIVSNPPYISPDDVHLHKGDVRFEPKSALISQNNGLNDIQKIVDRARFYLKPNAHLLIEHGYNQALAVKAIFNDFDYNAIQTHFDLSQNARVTSGIFSKKA